MPQKYRKKPVVIEAIQWTGHNKDDVKYFMRESCYEFLGDILYIYTLEGRMIASQNDYIIKGIDGEYYPCKPHIFEQTYDLVEERN